MRRRLARLAIATLAAGLTACGGGGGDPVSPEQAVVGTYTLRTVNGQPVPVTLTLNGVTGTISEGAVSLNADGSCSRWAALTVTTGGTTTTDRTPRLCTWHLVGNTVRMADVVDGYTTPLAVSGPTLTMIEGATLIFRRG